MQPKNIQFQTIKQKHSYSPCIHYTAINKQHEIYLYNISLGLGLTFSIENWTKFNANCKHLQFNVNKLVAQREIKCMHYFSKNQAAWFNQYWLFQYFGAHNTRKYVSAKKTTCNRELCIYSTNFFYYIALFGRASLTPEVVKKPMREFMKWTRKAEKRVSGSEHAILLCNGMFVVGSSCPIHLYTYILYSLFCCYFQPVAWRWNKTLNYCVELQ